MLPRCQGQERFIYSGDHPVAGRWGAHLEAQFRNGPGTRGRQAMVRPAVNIELGQRSTVTLGYAYSRGAVSSEHRPYEQAVLRHGEFSHRFRLEQRFISATPAVNRFRYRFQIQHPVSAATYVKLAAEPHVRFGFGYHGRAFAQQRAYAAVGRELAPHWRLEAGYLYQFRVPQAGGLYEHNHMIQLSVRSSAPLFGLWR